MTWAQDTRSRQVRLVAIVLSATMLLWMSAQWLGGRYVFLFDFAAIAAFVWALVVTFQIWRNRRQD